MEPSTVRRPASHCFKRKRKQAHCVLRSAAMHEFYLLFPSAMLEQQHRLSVFAADVEAGARIDPLGWPDAHFRRTCLGEVNSST
jgi:hypothetical protein